MQRLAREGASTSQGGRSVTVPKGSGLLPLCRSSPAGENELSQENVDILIEGLISKLGLFPLIRILVLLILWATAWENPLLDFLGLTAVTDSCFSSVQCAHLSILCTHQHYLPTPIRVLCTQRVLCKHLLELSKSLHTSTSNVQLSSPTQNSSPSYTSQSS